MLMIPRSPGAVRSGSGAGQACSRSYSRDDPARKCTTRFFQWAGGLNVPFAIGFSWLPPRSVLGGLLMARPDTDDGWLKYAHELDAALAVAPFGKAARIVLREVFAQVFGPAKRKSATLSAAEISALVGIARTNVVRGVTELVDSNLLQRLDDGTYRFNKDYQTWVRAGRKQCEAGSPLLSPAEVSFCVSAPARALSFRLKSASPETPKSAPVERIQLDNASEPVGVSNWIQNDPKCIQLDTGVCIQLDTKSVSNWIQNGGSHPISGDNKTEEDDKRETPSSGSVSNPILGRPTRPVKADPAEVARIIAWAETFVAPFEEIGSKIRMFSTSYPADWIEAAILCGVSGGTPGKVWAYAHKCLLSWWDRGKPNHAEIETARTAVANSPAAIPVTKTQRIREEQRAAIRRLAQADRQSREGSADADR